MVSLAKLWAGFGSTDGWAKALALGSWMVGGGGHRRRRGEEDPRETEVGWGWKPASLHVPPDPSDLDWFF